MAILNVEYIGVSELAAAAGAALSEIGEVDRRMKSGATEIPGERTIRFYLEKGLLPKPAKRLGQTLVFGRVHLLHLLVIKKLQADGVPLSAIPDILKKKGKTEAQLEELLDDLKFVGSFEELDTFQQRRGNAGLSDSLKQVADPIQLSELDPPAQPHPSTIEAQLSELEPPETPQTSASGAKLYLKSLLSRSPRRSLVAPRKPREADEPTPDVLYSVAPPTRSATPTAIFARHQLAPGVEINITDEYKPPANEQERARLIEKIRKILGL